MQQGLLKAGLAEMFGVFIFVLMGAGSICGLAVSGTAEPGHLVIIALASGLGMMAAQYGTAHVSGASINPAINIAMWISGQISLAYAFVYMAFQCVGAILAGFALRVMFPRMAGLEPFYFGTPNFVGGSEGDVSPMRAGMTEAILTFVLAWVVLSCAVDSRRQGKQFFGFAIGGIIMATILVGGNITGASLNPARYLGPAIAAGNLTQAGIYLTMPFIGAALAAVLYKFLFMQQAAPEDEV
jgi:MIP family channel proteins